MLIKGVTSVIGLAPGQGINFQSLNTLDGRFWMQKINIFLLCSQNKSRNLDAGNLLELIN